MKLLYIRCTNSLILYPKNYRNNLRSWGPAVQTILPSSYAYAWVASSKGAAFLWDDLDQGH